MPKAPWYIKNPPHGGIYDVAQKKRLWFRPKGVTGSVVRYRSSFRLTLIGAVFYRYPYDDYRYERRNRLPETER